MEHRARSRRTFNRPHSSCRATRATDQSGRLVVAAAAAAAAADLPLAVVSLSSPGPE